MLRVVFAVLLGLGLWMVSGNRVTADDEKKKVGIEIKRVKREADRTRERKVRDTRERTPNQREAAIKELRVHLEKLKAQQRKLEKSDDAEARKKIAIQIRSISSKLEDLQAVFRKETVVRKERRREHEEHPEIRAARNKLEHMRAAIKHLKEAGLTEYAQAVGQRAEKLQATIHRSENRGQEGGNQDVKRKGERPREEVRRVIKREQSTRREGAGNSELNQAILQIRKELELLRKEVRQLRGERGKKRDVLERDNG